MSLNILFSNAYSGLRAAQTALQVTSDNIANVDNIGYARKVVDQESAATSGAGAGVRVAQIRRVADQFLQSASLQARSGAAEAGVTADLLDQVQALFGLPTESYSLSSHLQELFAAFTELAGADPTRASRSAALTATQEFFSRAQDFAAGLTDVSAQAESRARDDISRVNVLLTSIADLNRKISDGAASQLDVSGLQQRQSEMVDELSGLIDVNVQSTSYGGVIVRAFDGREVAGFDVSPLSIENVAGEARLMIHTDGFPPHDVTDTGGGGSITGYLTFINDTGPALTAQISELTEQTAAELNRIHNAHSPAPPPTRLEGRAVSASLDAALALQSGSTTIALTDSAANITAKADITFTGGGAGDVNGVAFTDGASFLAALNTALAPGSASFTDGRLTLDGGGAGVVVTSAPSPATAPGFSQSFGLNDLLVEGDGGFSVRSDIVADPFALSLAQADLSGAVGTGPAVLKGDVRGADALGQSAQGLVNFNAVGGGLGGPQTLGDYLSGLGSNIARQTDSAMSRKANLDAVALEASARRSSLEGVNLDEELVQLTTYQQAYNASARVLQAANELYEILLNIGR